ncbi:ATP-binding protein [Niabella yanshanensis]|uniref:ATP-binding protein n=1 Tax=Niabella yanshanensis TaxID=577386 RepID=A0ABZ0WA82_9BACT|nr:ATP-binding protein [Niabella yanshanensis]WQD38890.1 ATP-binding protein [Niabella yanshanensis]
MEKKVNVNNTGIDSAGLTADYMQAIAEFIWNGFDAGATAIHIDFESNELDYISSLSVTDNGEGINRATIDESFGSFMDSMKRAGFQKTSSRLKGNKGKGRFSFAAFSGRTSWHTRYADPQSGHIMEYAITVKSSSKDRFEFGEPRLSPQHTTGTTVSFHDLFDVTAYSFSSPDFINFLGREFGWFLFLNKDKACSIYINDDPVRFDHLMAQQEVLLIPVADDDKETLFKATFIRWAQKIGDKFYFYFLDSKQKEVVKELTSFNNNAIGFYHSVYVESPFFDDFNANDKEQSLNLFDTHSSHSPVFKILQHRLHSLVGEKQKDFVKLQAADGLIASFEKTGLFPKFTDEEQEAKEDLVNVLKAIYTMEPRLFMALGKEQQKMSIGFIHLLLKSNKRQDIAHLLAQTIKLSVEEQHALRMILKRQAVAV